MRVAVVGGRTFNNYNLLKTTLNAHKITHIISGGAIGADTLAAVYCRKYNECFEEALELVLYLPEWNIYGKRAGAVRNQLIVDDAEYMIAFWDGESKGTKISIDMAKRKGIPVEIVYY